MISEFVSIKA